MGTGPPRWTGTAQGCGQCRSMGSPGRYSGEKGQMEGEELALLLSPKHHGQNPLGLNPLGCRGTPSKPRSQLWLEES